MPLPLHRRRAAAAAPLALALAAACGGGADARRAGRAVATDSAGVPCPSLDEAAAVAVADFVRQARPTPQRFLMSVGNDSVLPEPALRALQDRGPTWFFPPDARGQRELRDVLADRGAFNTLLVLWRGGEQAGTRAVVRLGGRYVGGSLEGRTLAPRSYTLTCAGGRWRVAAGREERSA